MTNEQLHELLPFRANGTLEGADLAAVDAALAEDADLRAELAALTAIRQTMQAEEVASPGEFGLARLMRDVDAETRVAAPVAANDNVVPLMRLRIWQVAAAVVLAVGIGFNLQQVGPGTAPMDSAEPAGFTLASGGSAADFTVVFAPDATEAELRALLLEAGLEIVSGPSALGIYGLGLIDAEASDAALAALSASAIVEDVQ
ncbi:hypothetical protein [Nioella aestuarii]|uniref:hypothetical protein n=1 Tax=Nioella aestuarii TaxID=1662864 RepID=UPI003D7FFC24